MTANYKFGCPRVLHGKYSDELLKRWEKICVELFARQSPEGWDVWGNEVECDIDLSVETSPCCG